MTTETSSPSSIPSRPTYSCIRCSDRKVKCDRQRPCSACVKHNVDCVFNLSQAPRKRHKRVKDQILSDRLRHYEALLQEQGIDPNKLPYTPNSEPGRSSSHTVPVVPNDAQFHTPSSVESEANDTVSKTQVVHGQGRFKFVDNILWSRVVEELQDPEDALEDSSNDTSSLEEFDDESSFVLNSETKLRIKPRHPPPERIQQLWQIFTDNVDPLTKVIHVPTVRPAIQRAASNLKTVPKSFEALMFAIYAAAVMSLKEDECKSRLGESRKPLLSRHISATNAALSRAKFMGTTSLVVLQALVLHLLAVRDVYEPRAVWTLTGVAVRIAHGMGLERDGTHLDLPPFETEMRRRVWWMLKTHDFRTAELCGMAKFRDLETGGESTKSPINVNDDQLYPGMPSFPVESDTLTDVVFICLRFELSNFAAGRISRFRQQGKSPSKYHLHASGNDQVEISQAFKEVEDLLETKYLRYCDPSQPLHLITLLIARFAMNVVRFLTHHPRRWGSIEQTPLTERQWVWELSVKLLEQHSMMYINPQLAQFAWQAAYYQQWHAFIHVLDSLRADPLVTDAEKAWRLIERIYQGTPDMIFDMKKPIHIAVGGLCLKAYSDREAALRRENMHLPPTPEFISQLRQQRELAIVKRQTRNAKSGRPEGQVSQSQTNLRNMGRGLDAGVTNLSDTLESTYLQQSTVPKPTSIPQHNQAIESDSFWFNNGFDDGAVGDPDGMMNMDLDFMLAQDSSMEDNVIQPINWEQWDAWLVDSNLLRPLASTWDSRMGS